ncbi:MAG: UvrD-helicase domain-containing protein [Methylibium sp.]
MDNIEFISAGAGSGKTYKLTETLAQALESGAARPPAILATTFTVKAATELRERARSWLLEKGRIDLATAIGQARLGTVNSVCGQMLKRFCFELGLSPDQTVLGEGQSKRLLKATLSETMDSAGQAELVWLTERFGIEQADWSKTVEDVVKAALDNDIAQAALRAMGAQNADAMLSNWPAPSTGPDPTAALAAALAKAHKDVVTYVEQTQAAGGKIADNLLKGLDALQKLDRLFRGGRWSWPDWIGAAGLDAGAKVRDLIAPVKTAAQAHESHPAFHAEVRRYLDLVFNLAADVLDAYEQAKKALGAVDFSDQEVLLLRALRTSPTVLSTPDHIEGALPLIHTPCTIVKVHGDYLDTRIRNTPDELATYPEAFYRLLDRIFDEFGLVIAGWSADWDEALRAAMTRAPYRRFSTYWTSRGDPSEKAADIIARRGATLVKVADADTFFDTLTEQVKALEEFSRPHPLSTEAAVATLKRYLSESKYRIALDDLVSREAENVVAATTGPAFDVNYRDTSSAALLARLRSYEAPSSTLVRMAFVAGQWCEESQVATWTRALAKLSAQRAQGGVVVWLELQR